MSSLERGTVDGGEYSTPDIDWTMGFHEVCKYWSVPAWNQPGSLDAVMINMDAWNALPEEMKALVEYTARETCLQMSGWQECANIGVIDKLLDAGVEMNRLPQEDLDQLQKWAYEFMEIEAAANPDYAKIARSQIAYQKDIKAVRDYQRPFTQEYSPTIYPDLSEEHLAELRG